MSRGAASGRIGDLGITKSLHCYGTADSNIAFGHQTFLDGKPFTVGVRNYPTSPTMTNDGTIFAYCYDVTTDKGYVMRSNGSTRAMQIFYGTSYVQTTNYRTVGLHYFFADFDGVNTLRIFRNTTLYDTLSIAPRTAHATNGVYFGTRDNTARHYAGVLGDGCIYDRLLTDAERVDIVRNAKYPSGALIQFKADENTGTTITDYSGNSRNGTATSILWRNSPFNA